MGRVFADVGEEVGLAVDEETAKLAAIGAVELVRFRGVDLLVVVALDVDDARVVAVVAFAFAVDFGVPAVRGFGERRTSATATAAPTAAGGRTRVRGRRVVRMRVVRRVVRGA